MDDKVYTHYVATVNWTILTVTYSFGLFFLDAYYPYMILTALVSLAIGNMFIYLNGMLRGRYVEKSDTNKEND